MKSLTKDELWLLDEKAAKGETIKLWLVWPTKFKASGLRERITSLKLTPGRKLYINDEPQPLEDITLEKLGFDFFTNYWHAYACALKNQSGEK